MTKPNFQIEKEVTIVIPTFNRCDYLEDAIHSCLNQTYNCDIIVCDHGSTDDTNLVLQKYKDKIQVIRREKDFGPHFCWLEGVLNARTEYVKLLFDDDWIDPTFVEKSLMLMNEDVGFVMTNAEIVFDNRTHEVFFLNKKTGIFKKNIIEKKIMLSGDVISPTCCLFRKSDLVDGIYQGNLWKNGGNYYHGVGPDIFVMLISLLRYKNFGFINEKLAFFRAHEGSITINASKDFNKTMQIVKAYEDVIEFYAFLKYFPLFKILYFFNPYNIFKKSFRLKIKHFFRNFVL